MATNGSTKAKSPAPAFRFKQYLAFSIISALLLIIANSAFWFNNYIFNTANFTQLTTTALLSDSSRNAISGEIVDKALANRPAIRNAVQEPATKLIAGLLDANIAKNVLNRAVTRLQIAVTSKNPESIAIDLTSIKGTLNTVVTVANSVSGKTADENSFDPNNIPDQIVLVDAQNLPNIYTLGTVLLWLGPISLLIGLLLLGYAIYQSRRSLEALSKTLALEGVIVMLGGVVAYLIGPLFQPIILAQVPDPNLRVVVTDIYQAFIGKFNAQCNSLYTLGLLLLIAGGVAWFINYRRTRKS
jgi:hypothetical protein